MKRPNRPDELLMKLSEGKVSEGEECELLTLMDSDKIDAYLSVIELEDELSKVDSSPVDFESRVMAGIQERKQQKKELNQALYGSFRNTFVGLSALLLVIGPAQLMNSLANQIFGSQEMMLANSFQTESIVQNQQLLASVDKNEVKVLIELVDGATKQKEFVTGVLRVNSNSPSQASLLLPKYEATVLKEFEKRIDL